MKSVLLNDNGTTLDGRYKLALIEPKNNGRGSMTDEGAMVLKSHPDTPYMNNRTGIAAAVYHAMVAASTSPELVEAVPVAFRHKLSSVWHYVDHRAPDSFELENCEIQQLFTAPPAPAATDKRIAKLEAENQALRAELDRVKQKAMVDYDEYIAGNRKDRADAERYRFLRHKTCIISGVFHILNMPNAGDEWRQKYDAAEQLDAAIDAAKGMNRG